MSQLAAASMAVLALLVKPTPDMPAFVSLPFAARVLKAFSRYVPGPSTELPTPSLSPLLQSRFGDCTHQRSMPKSNMTILESKTEHDSNEHQQRLVQCPQLLKAIMISVLFEKKGSPTFMGKLLYQAPIFGIGDLG